jgi:hypothetical protein
MGAVPEDYRRISRTEIRNPNPVFCRHSYAGAHCPGKVWRRCRFPHSSCPRAENRSCVSSISTVHGGLRWESSKKCRKATNSELDARLRALLSGESFLEPGKCVGFSMRCDRASSTATKHADERNLNQIRKFVIPLNNGIHLDFQSFSDGPRSGCQLLLRCQHFHLPWRAQRGDVGG